MRLPTYQFVAQMGAAIAVVGSLGLVAYELKQSRDMAIGELALSVYQAENGQYLVALDSEAYNRAVYKKEVSGEELTWAERKNLLRIMTSANGITIAKYQLWNLGLLSDGEWEWEVEKTKNNWTLDDQWRETMYTGNHKNKHFIEMLDKITAEWEVEQTATTK
jgi:hypothetical protein